MATNWSETVKIRQRLRSEIDHLREQQCTVLQLATYLGMTPHQAKEFEERSKRLFKVFEELMAMRDGK